MGSTHEYSEVNFQIATLNNTLGTKYDYKSVMHYGEYQFTKDPTKKTIDSRGNAGKCHADIYFIELI